LPSRLYYFRNQTGNAIVHNDYNYESETFRFRTNSDGSKLKSHLKYFADQGFVSKDLSAGEQLDTYTPISRTSQLFDWMHAMAIQLALL
jgi:hypothetical protein